MDWYTGTITRIWPHEQTGGFILTFKNTASSPSSIGDCKHKYAYFSSTKLQPELLKNSLSFALSAIHTGSTVGIVMDKDLDGEYCYAAGIDIRKN
jgi:hypothetical protein